MENQNMPSIKDYFKGKNVFITGGTGFMGKVLIEKLLRSCHTLDNIYVLMRPKKGKNLEQRLKIITDQPLFDVLKKQQPDAVKKIKPIMGDVTQLGLGLSDEDRQLLIKNTSVVYHAAASVRFDDHLTDAIIMNTRGTREVINLCKQVAHLDVFVHVSTTYCHVDKRVIEEKIYPTQVDWRDAIELAENMDKFTMDVFSTQYISPHPNTYTFTKGLSEHVVDDLCTKANIPFLIFRPSIVISTITEPIEGWIDNFNGPVALCIAIGKGILRTLYTDASIMSDFLPVDIIIRAIIVASWAKALEKDPVEKYKGSIYNASNNKIDCITQREVMDMGMKIVWEYSLNNVLWFPKCTATKCWYQHFLIMIFYQLLPALFIDGMLKVTGRKPILIKLHRKIYIANMALQFFISQEWSFVNDKSVQLEHKILPQDMEDFRYNRAGEVEIFEYFRKSILGGRRYLMKEDDATIESAKKNLYRMWILSIIFDIVWYLTIFYVLLYKIDIIHILSNTFNNTLIYLTQD